VLIILLLFLFITLLHDHQGRDKKLDTKLSINCTDKGLKPLDSLSKLVLDAKEATTNRVSVFKDSTKGNNTTTNLKRMGSKEIKNSEKKTTTTGFG
jgi:hypothetical protein